MRWYDLKMDKLKEDIVGLLVESEPLFKKAGEFLLKIRQKTKIKNKYNTGIRGVDIVTEADLEVQEMILSELAKTRLADCQLIAEEDTPSIAKFNGTNGLVLTLDPIDGTILYASNKRFFSVIVCLHDTKSMLYSFNHYPVLQWSRRITFNKIKDFGHLPEVQIKPGVNLNKTISHTFGNPQKAAPELYEKITNMGYEFKLVSEITDESGSCTLFYLDEVPGYYTENPGAYDGLCALHFAQAKKYKIYSTLDISKPLLSPRGFYYPGYYVALKKP